MTGFEIIKWAVKKCEERDIPPSDSALIRMIREQGGAEFTAPAKVRTEQSSTDQTKKSLR